MAKPTYYLLRDNYVTRRDYEDVKMKYVKMGFRVVTFTAGENKNGLQDGIRALIKNNIENFFDKNSVDI